MHTHLYIEITLNINMEKDIDRIQKNPETDIVIRIDDFGGRRGVTIREFVKSDRYTGFTKAGTRISAEKFKLFKAAINSIDEKDLEGQPDEPQEQMQQSRPQQRQEYKPSYSQESPGKKEVKKKAKIENVEEVEF